MWLLALETTTQHGSLALFHHDACVACVPLAGRAYAATLIPAMQQLLHEHDITLKQLDLLAAANGPGSFTGVRIGLATIKALMEVNGTPVVAVGTLEAMAAGVGRPVLAVMDAGRGMVYAGVYPAGEELEESAAAFGERLAAWKGRAVTPDAALAARWARVETLDPLLARSVGGLALQRWGEPATVRADALTLDARYLGARWGR